MLGPWTRTPTPPRDHDDDDHDRGLQFDLSTLVGRRRLLGLFAGGAGAAALTACGLASATRGGSSGSPARRPRPPDRSGTLTETPEETAGPYPGDGSNGVNVLSESGIVRSDIRCSFGSSTTTAPGVPLTITLKVVDQTGAAQAGHAVYLWHCDRDGKYSMYTVANENYLRGVQETAADGTVTFTSIFPAATTAAGRTSTTRCTRRWRRRRASPTRIGTSQIALPAGRRATSCTRPAATSRACATWPSVA